MGWRARRYPPVASAYREGRGLPRGGARRRGRVARCGDGWRSRRRFRASSLGGGAGGSRNAIDLARRATAAARGRPHGRLEGHGRAGSAARRSTRAASSSTRTTSSTPTGPTTARTPSAWRSRTRSSGGPETYRIDPALQYLPGEFGIPTRAVDAVDTHYGDLASTRTRPTCPAAPGRRRAATCGCSRARRRWPTPSPPTALLLLLDTKPGDAQHARPLRQRHLSSQRRLAVLLTPGTRLGGQPATGPGHPAPERLQVAANPAGYVNALEAKIPRSAIPGPPATSSVAAATGIADGDHLKDLGLGRQPRQRRLPQPRAEPGLVGQAAGVLPRAGHDRPVLRRRRPRSHSRAAPTSATCPGPTTTTASSTRRRRSPRRTARRACSSTTASTCRRATAPTTRRRPVVAPLPRRQRAHRRGRRAADLQGQGEDLGTIVVSPDGRGT